VELADGTTGRGKMARGGCLYAWNFSVTRSTVFNPLTPELNPSAPRCLTRLLLGILLLESCISLIYA
jgi:hypothetical protein